MEPGEQSRRLLFMIGIDPGRARWILRLRRKLILSGSLAAMLLMQSCAAAALKGYYTPAEALQNASALTGREITVQGKVEVVSISCTTAVCPPDNPCCNQCAYQLGFRLSTYRYIYFSGKYGGCSGNSCNAECQFLEPGKTYRVSGILRAPGTGLYYLEVDRWKPIEG
jgi:hypothetical protein